MANTLGYFPQGIFNVNDTYGCENTSLHLDSVHSPERDVQDAVFMNHAELLMSCVIYCTRTIPLWVPRLRTGTNKFGIDLLLDP